MHGVNRQLHRPGVLLLGGGQRQVSDDRLPVFGHQPRHPVGLGVEEVEVLVFTDGRVAVAFGHHPEQLLQVG